MVESMYKLAWIQGKSQNKVAANLDYYESKIQVAAKNQADLILLPELFATDYFCISEKVENFDLAFELNGKEVQRFQKLAKSLKVNLTLPFFERVSSAIFYNTMLVIDENGEIISHYRKMHIPHDPGFNEKYYFSPGDKGFQVVNCNGVKLGLLICWDQWFPEAARLNALQGAELIVYPTAIGWDDNEDSSVYPEQVEAWTTIMRAHAIANNVFVAATNRVGREGHLNFWGHSFVANPFGKILQQDGVDETISQIEIDLAEVEKARRIWPYFRDRRIDSYGDLTKKWLEK